MVGSAPHWPQLLSSCEARDSAVRRLEVQTSNEGYPKVREDFTIMDNVMSKEMEVS